MEDEFSITQDEFVQEFKDLKDHLISGYFSEKSEISRLKTLDQNGFDNNQTKICKAIMDDVLTDAMYTILLALDGCASINKHQIMYKLFDEANNEVTGGLDSIAWEKFHENRT